MAEKQTHTVIGWVVGAIGVVVALLAWLHPVGAPSAESEEASSPNTPVTPPAAIPSAGTEVASAAAQEAASPPPAAPVKSDLSHLDLSVARGSNGAGWGVGNQLYALNDSGRLSIDLGWALYDTDGERRTDSSCQIVLQLDGPGDQQRRRFSSCEGEARSFFDGWPEALTAAGTWTASVTDELTGLTSSTQFTVLHDRNG